LETYKDLADNAASLRGELKASEAALTSERSRVERRDEMIRDLKDEITALKLLQSTTSTARSTAQSSHATRPSSRLMAPLLAQTKLGLAAQMTSPGLASRMEVPPETDRFNDPSGGFANDVPDVDTPMPEGWEHNPNCDSNMSVWDEMKGPGDVTKAPGKKHKKRAHNSEPQPDSWEAAREKATREYLAQSTKHTVADDALKRELRLAFRAFAL
jgi:hypothetical protein